MSKDQTKPQIPFALEYESAENEITDVVNKAHSLHGVPFIFIEKTLTILLYQVREQAKAEREMARKNYMKQLDEYHKEKSEEGNDGP